MVHNYSGFLKQGDTNDVLGTISKVSDTIICWQNHGLGAAKHSAEIRGGRSGGKRLKVKNINEMVGVGKGRCCRFFTGVEI